MVVSPAKGGIPVADERTRDGVGSRGRVDRIGLRGSRGRDARETRTVSFEDLTCATSRQGRLRESFDVRVSFSGQIPHGSVVTPIIGGLRQIYEVVPFGGVKCIVGTGGQPVPRVNGSGRQTECQ